METTMKAAVFKGEGVLKLEDRPAPVVRDAHDVLLAVRGVGVCGTDLHILEVPPRHPATKNVIMGHEFGGDVIATGTAVTNCKPGDRVIADQNAGCGHCEECRRGYPNACLTVFSAPVKGFANTPGIFHDGALARYVVIPDYMVYPIPASIPWKHASVTETVACAFNGVRKAKPEAGETALVLGAGPVGLLMASMLKRNGLRVIQAEVSPYRAAVAKQISDVVVNPREQNLAQVVNDETHGHGVDIAMEAVGPLFNECIENARFGGRIILFGHDELARPQVQQAAIMRKELQITGAFLAKYSFVPALQLLEQKALPMDLIVSHVMPLDQIFEAHRLMKAGQALKVVVDPSV